MKQRVKKIARTQSQLASRNVPRKVNMRQAVKGMRQFGRALVRLENALWASVPALAQMTSVLARAAAAMCERGSATIH